jgi:hypothetical protein
LDHRQSGNNGTKLPECRQSTGNLQRTSQKFGTLYNRLNLMPNRKALDEHYRTLSDGELLKLVTGGGFTEKAEPVLHKELARRNLTFDDAKRHFAPEWLDKTDVGTVGVVTLESGEKITAEVVGLNEEGDRLSVRVISPDSPHPNGRRNHRAIPLHRIVSFEPQPDLMAQWPFSDPCRDVSLSNPRFIVLTTIFLCLIVGSLPLFLLLASRSYGLQEASIITYTLFEVCSSRLQEPAVESPARMFRPSSSRAPLSSRRFRAFFGVTLAFSLHCLPFKPQC